MSRAALVTAVIEVIDPLPVRIDNLCDRIERLAPSHRDPHRFFEDKSDIAYELRRLAREVR